MKRDSSGARCVCIHGHFYQPPRENPWLDAIELQDGAYPYHDWNERIAAECYAPNAASRILDGHGRIVDIVNNYSRISFNFGPTLLAWLVEKAPEVYQAVLEADRDSLRRFGGHGSALAQPYNHSILPLCNARDQSTQVHWGIRDFERRFSRKPEGMWLPETAVDLACLEVLAQHGIQFTILAPRQAARVRAPSGGDWTDVSGGRIDTQRAYQVHLPSGRTMAVLFYDDPISRAVAFEGLLTNGEQFAQRLLTALPAGDQGPRLINIATDGETYGHHHRHGDMALAYALHTIESKGLARLANYAEFLEHHPPQDEVEILERTSWSCSHGLERWRSACGCSSGSHPGWKQDWRAPLREALDWLRDALTPRFEDKGRMVFKDPWGARDGYIDVLLDGSPQSRQRFLEQHSNHNLDEGEKVPAWKLLEIERQALFMYTSCGWFFDELSGIETVQVLRYAGRAIQLAEEVFQENLEEGFLERLAKAPSNLAQFQNGRGVYDQLVRPARVDLHKVAAHYAVSSLFEEPASRAKVYRYEVEREDHRRFKTGKAKLAMGRARVSEGLTGESRRLVYAALHFGDHNIHGCLSEFDGDAAYESLAAKIQGAFSQADLSRTMQLMDRHLAAPAFSLSSLFHEEQRRVLDTILDASLAVVENEYRQVYENNAPLMRFLSSLAAPLPAALQTAAEFVLNTDLRRAFSADTLDLDRIVSLLSEAKVMGVRLDGPGLGYALQRSLERLMARLVSEPEKVELVSILQGGTRFVSSLPFTVDLWKVQNLYHELLQDVFPKHRQSAEQGDEQAKSWTVAFLGLGEQLKVRVPAA